MSQISLFDGETRFKIDKLIITSSVLMALFGEMLDIDWREKVNDLVEELQDK